MKWLFILIFLFLAFISSKIKIKARNFSFKSDIKPHFNKYMEVDIILKIFNIIPIFKIKIKYDKIKKIISKKFIKDKLQKEKNNAKNKKINRNIIKLSQNSIKSFNLQISVSTENAECTALIIPTLSTIISLFLEYEKIDCNRNIQFKIIPIYKNENLLNIYFSGIFEIKMIHIINTICDFNNY